jgi:glycosyltransferase involved in cell wall biosynthesis
VNNTDLKVTLSCIGKFHHFDLARQLNEARLLDVIHTGYPRWKLRGEGFPSLKVDTFPWLQTLFMAQGRLPFSSVRLSRFIYWAAAKCHDAHVARVLRPCNIFVGLSGHNYKAGRRAKSLGAHWVCDRGSSHIRYQAHILKEEYLRWGIPFNGVPKWAIEAEEAEYAACDLITIPSLFAERTFIEAGVPHSKLRRIPYGVDLKRFSSVCEPANGRFDVVFVGGVGVRKGIPYLIEAFRLLKHPHKSLKIIGSIEPSFAEWVRNIRDDNIMFLGSMPQVALKEFLSRSHVFVLPSVEDGFGMVMAQAMACGCPVIATENTGGPDLISDGKEGYVVPIRDAKTIAEAMQRLADFPSLQREMSIACLSRVNEIQGWTEYGRAYIEIMRELNRIIVR